MAQTRVRERERAPSRVAGVTARPLQPPKPAAAPTMNTQTKPAKQKVEVRERPQPQKRRIKRKLQKHEDEPRFQHELREMRETHDLDEVDDDVEAEATIYEWQAEEHNHRPKTRVWFAILAAGTTVAIGLQLIFFANFFGAITLALVGGLVYYIAQQEPATVRYRIMIDGIALNSTLYHWQDLDVFNVIYEPDETKTVIFRSKRRLAPYIHMEVGDADPVEIRDILLEFLQEDQEMEEPFADVIARRLGF